MSSRPATAAATALLVAAPRAASLKKRLEELPPAVDGAGASAFNLHSLLPAGWRAGEAGGRAGADRREVAREKKEFEARERYLEMKKLSGSRWRCDGEWRR